jgi:chitin disaccharide deacetylase
MLKQLINNLKRNGRQFIEAVSSSTIQQRLGYKRNTKLLIIHADDLGLAGSQNDAFFEAIKNGMVNSGSIMVPCLKFGDIIDYSKTHPEADLGVHLTITSEWSQYKWRPVLHHGEVASITDQNGYLLESKRAIAENAIAGEVEKEFRAQIKLALESGIELTHIDSHMFSAWADEEILGKYIALGKEFNLPLLLTHELPIRNRDRKNAVILDRLYIARADDNIKGLNNFYSKVLNSMKPGLNCILIHAAFDNKEMQDITSGQINYGSAWRQADFDFFTGNECRQLIERNNIQLITWREIRDKLIRK